jgi:predicted MFS family arabinose efflux permease
MTIYLIPYLITHGHATSFAATIAGLFGLMSLVGRLASAPVAERVSRLKLTLGLMLIQGAGLAVLAVAGTSPIGALIYIALFGASSGILTIMRAALLAEQYGPAHYGAINGAQNLVLTSARTVAPVGAGVVVSALGGYEILLWGLVGLLVLGAASMATSYRRA